MSFDKDSWDAALWRDDRDDEIARLRAENERLRADLEKARWDHNNTIILAQHDNERLRAALEKIATSKVGWASVLQDVARAALAAQPAPGGKDE